MRFDFSPSKEFRKKTKERFLAAFDARYPAPRAAWPVFIGKTLATAVAVVAVFLGGASVYADTANVPADNILYPLKRLHEDVRLTVAPTDEKAQLQASFAARRVMEIDDLAVRKPSSTAIAKLANDADASVNASIATAAQTNLGDGALTKLCGNLLSTVTTSSVAMEGELQSHAELLARFTSKCEAASDIATKQENASSSITSSTTTGGDHGGRKGRPANVAAPLMAATTSASSSASVSVSASTSLEARIQNFLNKTIRTQENDNNEDGNAGGSQGDTNLQGKLNLRTGGESEGESNSNNLVRVPSF